MGEGEEAQVEMDRRAHFIEGLDEETNRRIEVSTDPNTSKYPIPKYLMKINDTLFSIITENDILALKASHIKEKEDQIEKEKINKVTPMVNNNNNNNDNGKPFLLKSKPVSILRGGMNRNKNKKIILTKEKQNNPIDLVCEDEIEYKNDVDPAFPIQDEQRSLGVDINGGNNNDGNDLENGLTSKNVQESHVDIEFEREQINDNYKVMNQMKKSLGQIQNDILCVVCVSKQVNCVVMPCGHSGICQACAISIFDKKGTCPICRSVV